MESSEQPPRPHFLHRLDRSALLMLGGILLLFASAIAVTLIAPRYVDSTWTTPSSPYQVQMYELDDPHFYISSASTEGSELAYVHHLEENVTLSAFQEDETLRLVAPPNLEPFITRHGEAQLKLTSRILFLREPLGEMQERSQQLLEELQGEESDPESAQEPVSYRILELYDPQLKEAFAWEPEGGILRHWAEAPFLVMDEERPHPRQGESGVVYVLNPREFRVRFEQLLDRERWGYDPEGRAITTLEELKGPLLGFYSRQHLIELGEHLYAIEGCWFCHTDQTRTLIEDVVLNGTDGYPAPPSSANEYIYQKITFPGTRRIGPDLSRAGVQRPSRNWHRTHFWTPRTVSAGTLMPAFPQFFDSHARGTGKGMTPIPNERFEAMYQYLMTKGTRITPPNQAWWLGKDPVKTKEIIEGARAP